MSRKEYVLLAVLTVISGLVGGALSNRIFSASPAHAGLTARHEACLQAEAFQLLDPDGNVRAELAIHPDGNPGLTVIDENFRVRTRIALTGDGSPSSRGRAETLAER
jgi:hypothetical protein